ncbi:hypothetical protein L1987_75376 [Smallanthus sonchifolius]|uniref:Uncharacterized protein n=1 Tax=Smallanthus sonchifolius TaxID=185202 RepID=A0ACB9A5S5_9ASTR|nr:hypothetical protein L1987_75376 [Smallanthus sonchifolius]
MRIHSIQTRILLRIYGVFIFHANLIRKSIEQGLMCDILWIDPQPNPGREQSKHGFKSLFRWSFNKKVYEG